MNPFNKILRALVMTRIRSFPKTEILIFDNMSSDVLERLILHDMKYFTLPVRYEIFYISRTLIIKFIKNFISKYLRHKKYRSLYFIYLLSSVECLGPKVVLTFIDNNFLFHMISSVYTKAEFYTIQNGIRNKTKRSLPEPVLFGNKFPIANYVCFGSYESDFLKQYGYHLDKIHPVGSLIGGYYKSQNLHKEMDTKFDLCLVSQWGRERMKDFNTKKAIITLNEYLQKFMRETKISLCVATCSQQQEEIDYFKENYGENVQIINYDRVSLSTYFAMDNSCVVISINSTAAYEAFGWGKKVLFCNFSGDSTRNFPMQGFWSLYDSQYESFRNSLRYLLDLDYGKYVDLTQEAARYVMNYDFQMPAHKYIRKIIFECLKK